MSVSVFACVPMSTMNSAFAEMGVKICSLDGNMRGEAMLSGCLDETDCDGVSAATTKWVTIKLFAYLNCEHVHSSKKSDSLVCEH